MAYRWETWLADALRAEGCRVAEYSGWKSRGRPTSTGAFAPYGVTLHHTGTTTSAANPCPTLGTCVNGRADLPGPLAHVVIGYDGTCHVIAAGRANHAGTSTGPGPFPAGDGNAMTLGFEIDYSGSQDVSTAQGEATLRAATAVLRHYGRSAAYCVGHKESSDSGKWDPGRDGASSPYYLMDNVRAQIAQRLAGTTGGDEVRKDDDPMVIQKACGGGTPGDGMYLLNGGKLCGITADTWNNNPRPPVDMIVTDLQMWNRMVANFGAPTP
jgi:N-acetylmuramoyl-L-alanine amidase-like protein